MCKSSIVGIRILSVPSATCPSCQNIDIVTNANDLLSICYKLPLQLQMINFTLASFSLLQWLRKINLLFHTHTRTHTHTYTHAHVYTKLIYNIYIWPCAKSSLTFRLHNSAAYKIIINEQVLFYFLLVFCWCTGELEYLISDILVQSFVNYDS